MKTFYASTIYVALYKCTRYYYANKDDYNYY